MTMLKKTLRFSAFSVAALTVDVVVFTAEQDCIVRQPCLNNVVDFAGGAVSAFTASLGKEGAETGLIGATNMFTGAANGRANLTMGADGVDVFLSRGQTLEVRATSVTANLNALTAGVLEAIFEVVPLPSAQT